LDGDARSLNFLAPIYSRASESIRDARHNIDFLVNYWLYKGVDKEKLIVTVNLYGKSFDLFDASDHFVGSMAKKKTTNLTQVTNFNSFTNNFLKHLFVKKN
jgi:hypothetical protein